MAASVPGHPRRSGLTAQVVDNFVDRPQGLTAGTDFPKDARHDSV
jgi:hypothetical protein